MMEGLASVGGYDHWIAPQVYGIRPEARYQHGSVTMHDKMFIFGGILEGQYSNDLQVLDLKSLTWSKIEARGLEGSPTSAQVAPCAGHSLITWKNKIISVAGHSIDLLDTVTVREFDPQTCTWSNLETFGEPPMSRECQSATLVGAKIYIFGGHNPKKSYLNDLHSLDLETMIWRDYDAICKGVPPLPRSSHVAAFHSEGSLLIFGGGSHTTWFCDLHVLDLQKMEWSSPKQQGVIPNPRDGLAGVTVGQNWYIVGGGVNKDGISETLVLNMSLLKWSLLTSVEGHSPLASEGLSLVSSMCNGDDFLLSFGGYNGYYSDEVYVLKLSQILDLQLKMLEGSPSTGNSHKTRGCGPSIHTIGSEDPTLHMLKAENERLRQQIAVLNQDVTLHLLKAENERLRQQMVVLNQDVTEEERRTEELTKELKHVHDQLEIEEIRSGPQGRYDDEIRARTMDINANPSHIWPLLQRGELYEKLGRFEEAIADVQKALEVDPTDNQVATKIGRLWQLKAMKQERENNIKRAKEFATYFTKEPEFD